MGIGRRNQILSVGQLVVEKRISDGIDLAWREPYDRTNCAIGETQTIREVVIVPHRRKSRGRPIVGKSGGDGGPVDSNFGVRGVRVLIGPVEEQFVFDNGQTDRSASSV